jgi:hypothetical protein
LPVKAVYLIIVCVVKTLLREVLSVTIHQYCLVVHYFTSIDVKEEMMVRQSSRVKQVYEKQMLFYKNA